MAAQARAKLLARDWFLPLYDPLTRLLGVDSARRMLLDQAALQPQYRVLDVGCGAGNYTLKLLEYLPRLEEISDRLPSTSAT
mgnify:CR=1 FL=1